MRPTPRARLALAFAAGVAAGPLALWGLHLRAQETPRPDGGADALTQLVAAGTVQFGGFGGGGAGGEDDQTEPPRVVHVTPPVTARAARVWETLQKPVTVKLPNETPLEDFLKLVREQTRGKGPDDKGFSIFVDPVGLQESEKTMTSPVTVDLQDVPLSTVLTLTLKQLNLTYHVHPDGILMIVNTENDDPITDPSAKILDEIGLLRQAVAELRMTGGSNRPAAAGSPALRAEISELRARVNAMEAAQRSGSGQPAPATRKAAPQ